MASAYCILDTSVLVEFLGVPGMRNEQSEIQQLFMKKKQGQEVFLLPIATLIETGNHVANIGDGHGNRRYQCAQKLIRIAKGTLNGTGGFSPMNYISKLDVQNWITTFDQNVESGVGVGDSAIIQEYNAQCSKVRQRVYISSLDEHLIGYDTHPYQP